METQNAISQGPVIERIVIIGPTGAGKTTVGAALATLLGWRFLDLDAAISAAAGLTVREIFAREGLSEFRAREAAALAEALAERRLVIACGAGIVEPEGNLPLALQRAWVVALACAPETSLRRATTDADAQSLALHELRPMLAGPDALSRIHEMTLRRQPLYAQAHVTVATDTITADAVAARIAADLIARGRMPDAGATAITRRITAGTGYDAVVGWGALSELPARLRALDLPPRLSVVSDSSVAALYAEPAMERLRAAGFTPDLFVVPAGEESKSREQLNAVHDWLAERRIERGEGLIALGGGVVGDLAGFAAATYLRGLPLVHVPTSLLAQVDASIGGKVAIDHPRGKNLIGAFYQPRLVLADTATLLTLPTRQRVEGWAEVIKHGAALDAEYFAALERQVDALLALEPAATTAVIARSVAIKASVIEGDEREGEGGRRALLNFGHTLGHAIEAVTGYQRWLHGEAVSMGMIFASRLGWRMDVTPRDVVDRLEALLTRFGLPTRIDGLSAPMLLRATLWDKKARGGRVRWALLTALGESALFDAAPENAVRATLLELGATDDELGAARSRAARESEDTRV
ncbi:MAG TPA: 3-dehydroquinate synthase [Ktedonobacterales bacterium]|jgi:3-dehydroquinate synthase|nr:3-dehydroquinate synthase [Ktedonobacterales bacterium]